MSVQVVSEAVLSCSATWRRWTFDVPFLGTLDLTLNCTTRGRTWFDTDGEEPGKVEVWVGRLNILASRDTGIRPDKRTVALAAFVAAEVVRWLW